MCVQHNALLSWATVISTPPPPWFFTHGSLSERCRGPSFNPAKVSSFLSLKCLKCYQRVGVFIKESHFKEFHLLLLPRPPTRASSPFNLAGVWQSKVNKCEMGHVFSIVSLCHTCSPLSMINIPPTSGLPFLGAPCASRRLACQNTPWPPGITERSKPTLPVHLKSIEPIRSPHKWRMTRFWNLCCYWKTLLFLMNCLLVLVRQK